MTKKKILFVDDDDNITLMTKMRLEVNGYDVQTAATGLEAMNLVKAWKPDLLILDPVLPTDLNGHEICMMLNRDAETKGLPIIILTATADKTMQLKCLRAGAKAVVMKPFNPQELLALIKKAFDPDTRWRKPESILE